MAIESEKQISEAKVMGCCGGKVKKNTKSTKLLLTITINLTI
jgi:hypothetical protein